MKKLIAFILLISIAISFSSCCLNGFNDPFAHDEELRNSLLDHSLKIDGFVDNISDKEKKEYLNPFVVSFEKDVSINSIYKAVENYDYSLLSSKDERVFLIDIFDIESFVNKNSSIINNYSADNKNKFTLETSNNESAEIISSDRFDFSSISQYNNSSDVIIAVLDSGVNKNHVALQGSNILQGFDATNNTIGIIDDVIGHGTSVIGLIAASKGNETQVEGLIPNATILPIKVTDENGEISTSSFVRAIYHAVDSGADIINMSFCGMNYIEAEQEAITYAFENGCVLVGATGNFDDSSHSNKKTYPSSYDHVVSVSSVNNEGELSDFSFFEDYIDVCAPGENIKVISGVTDTAVISVDGTSFSAPYISSLVSVIISNIEQNFSINSDEMKVLLRRNAFVVDGVRCVDILKTIENRNEPIVCGIENNATYFTNITITFNQGRAFLNGEEIKSGHKVNISDEYEFVIQNNEYLVMYRFVIDNIPLEFTCPEGDVYYEPISIEFSRGTATLNGEPYYSGKRIFESGVYQFVLYGPLGNKVEKNFSVYIDMPEVFGVENNKVYNTDVAFKIVGQGSAHLNGERIEIGEEIFCSKNGIYELVISNVTDSQLAKYIFEIKKEVYQSNSFPHGDIKLSYDEISDSLLLYSDEINGLRLYSAKDISKIKKVVLISSPIESVVVDNGLIYCLSKNSISVLFAKDIYSESFISDVFEYDFEIKDFIVVKDEIFLLTNEGMTIIDSKSGEIKKSINNDQFNFTIEYMTYIPSLDSVVVYPDESSELYFYSVVDGNISSRTFLNKFEKIITGGGYIYSNGIIYDSNFNIHSFVDFTDAVGIKDNYLITKDFIYDIEQYEKIGSFSDEIQAFEFCKDRVVLLRSSSWVDVYPMKETISETMCVAPVVGDKFYVVNSNGSLTEILRFDDEFKIKQWCYDEQNNLFYVLPENENRFLVIKDDFTFSDSFGLKDVPVYIYSYKDSIIIFFESIDEVLVIKNGVFDYKKIDFELKVKMCVGDDLLFALSDGVVYRIFDDFSCEIVIDREDIISIGYSSTVSNLYAVTIGGYLLKFDEYSGELLGQTESIPTYNPIIISGSNIIVENSFFNAETLVLVGSFQRDILDLYNRTVLLSTGIYNLDNNVYSDLGYIFENLFMNNNKELFGITDENEIIKYLNPFNVDSGVFPDITISGTTVGEDSYLGDVVLSFGFGYGFLNGYPINSETVIENGGSHRFTVVLPYGQTVDKFFNITAEIKSIDIIGKNEIYVNEFTTLRPVFRPIGSVEKPVAFSSNSPNVLVNSNGEVIGLSAGEAEIICQALDGSVFATFKMKVLPFEVDFSNDRFTLDTNKKYVLNIPCRLKSSEFLRFVKVGNGSARIVNVDNSIVEPYDELKSGMTLEILNSSMNVVGEYTLALIGDVDGDGRVMLGDLVRIGKHFYNNDPLTEGERMSADVTGDGKLSIADIVKLKNHILGKDLIYYGSDQYQEDSDRKVSFYNSDTAVIGEEFKTILYLDSNDVYTIKGSISFDKNVLEFKGINSSVSSWEVDFFENNGTVEFLAHNFDHDDNDLSDGALVVITFVIRSDVNTNDSTLIKVNKIATEYGLLNDLENQIVIKDNDDSTLLSNLIINDGNINLNFKKSVLKYWITVPYDVSKLKVDYVTHGENAMVSVNNPELVVGTNTITLTVSFEGNQTEYQIFVTRSESSSLSSESKASLIKPNAGNLSPSFSSDIYEYTLNLDRDVKISFIVEMIDPDGIYSVKEVENGYIIRCVAEDGTETEYKITKEISFNDQSQPNKDDAQNDYFWIVIIVSIVLSIVCIIIAIIVFHKRNK